MPASYQSEMKVLVLIRISCIQYSRNRFVGYLKVRIENRGIHIIQYVPPFVSRAEARSIKKNGRLKKTTFPPGPIAALKAVELRSKEG